MLKNTEVFSNEIKEAIQNLINERINQLMFEIEQNNPLLKEEEHILEQIKEKLPANCDLLFQLENTQNELEYIKINKAYISGLKDVENIKSFLH